MTYRFRAGLIVAVLGLASVAPLTNATTNDAIDTVTTGAIRPAASVDVAEPKGSPAFRAALATLLDGDAVAAYAEASALSDELERRTMQWTIIYFSAGQIDFAAIERFVSDAPDFASASVFGTRIEQSLTKTDATPEAVISALGAAPSTIEGQIMLAEAHLAQGDSADAARLAKSLWANNFLTEEQETRISVKLGALLTRDDHWARTVHLMMNDRARGSERLISHLSAAQTSLVVARAAVSRNDADAKARLDSVDPSMRSDPVFIFSRAQRARQFDLWQSAVDWLAKAPDTVPNADQWWYERRALLRKLLDVGEPKLAYEVAAGFKNGSDGRMVDAQFHAGWIALSFLNDASAAKAHFTTMAGHTTLPDTITQANYWLARANLALGEVDAARLAFAAAAKYGTVYYGQLAQAELGEVGADIRPLPAWEQSEALFNRHKVVRAVRLLAANGQAAKAVALLRNFGNGLKTGGEMALAARLAEEIGAHHLAISIAGTAEQRGTPLDLFSFPSDVLPADAQLATSRAAVYAVARQESMFQVDAVSSAGARGLMQLMPGTAQDVSRKVGVDYSPSRLVTDPAYNALLGSTYLGNQLNRYDGSLVLAAAAYNAGPGNADKWIKAYGDPRELNVDPVIWVELIPFPETRTYVKRVLGNYLVYRERLGDSPLTLQQALRTIH